MRSPAICISFLNSLTEKMLESLCEQSMKEKTLNGILNEAKDKKALGNMPYMPYCTMPVYFRSILITGK